MRDAGPHSLRQPSCAWSEIFAVELKFSHHHLPSAKCFLAKRPAQLAALTLTG